MISCPNTGDSGDGDDDGEEGHEGGVGRATNQVTRVARVQRRLEACRVFHANPIGRFVVIFVYPVQISTYS